MYRGSPKPQVSAFVELLPIRLTTRLKAFTITFACEVDHALQSRLVRQYSLVHR